MAVEGVARGGRWRARCVKKEDCRRPKRGKDKRRMRSLRHPGKNSNRNETVDKHKERPNGALRKVSEQVREPEPHDDATHNGWVKQ